MLDVAIQFINASDNKTCCHIKLTPGILLTTTRFKGHLLFPVLLADILQRFFKIGTLSLKEDFIAHLKAARIVWAAMMFQNRKTLLIFL